MPADLVHVGFGNFIELRNIVAVVTPGSAPIQRMIRDAKRRGFSRDHRGGRRTKAVVFTGTGDVILVAITPEALAGRVTAARAGKMAQAQAD
jgi:regulator of extracellular matrix RemA (YlzA/DUF370 family)